MESLIEIDEKFLRGDVSPAIRLITLKQLTGLTATPEGCELLAKSPVLPTIVKLVTDPCPDTQKTILNIMVNISSLEIGCLGILRCSGKENLIRILIDFIVRAADEGADYAAMMMSNMTRTPDMLEMVVPQMKPLVPTLQELEAVFRNVSLRRPGRTLDYIAMLLCNLSRHIRVRRALIDRNNRLLPPLLPFTDYPDSAVRRQGVIGVIKNCTFNIEMHDWLLNEVEILPRLLLPLAGGEEYTDEETEKLPAELQYLHKSKEREFEHPIRKEILEIFNKLCTTEVGRVYLRKKNAYLILRDYHKWETNRACRLACENVVDILIRTEEEIGRDNIEEGVEVTEELVEKFKQMDTAFLED